MHGGEPQNLVWSDKSEEPTVVSLHIEKEDLYYDVVFHAYSGDANGGGFQYTRTRALVPGCTDPNDVGYNPRANLDDESRQSVLTNQTTRIGSCPKINFA